MTPTLEPVALSAGPGAENAGFFPPLTQREFIGYRDLVMAETGILLTEQKRELLVARLSRRIRTLGLRSLGEYLTCVTEDRRERLEMVDRILTNETRFFREPLQFEFLESQLAVRWLTEARTGRRERSLRIWSAGCSTGQEPVSIAMTLLTALPGWELEILATDLSSRALSQASSGLWPLEKASEIPERHRKAHMMRGVRSNDSLMKCDDAVMAAIRYRRLALNRPFPDIGLFDAIFCRNVLIYFDPESRREVMDRILTCLRPGAVLFLGHSESLVNISGRVRTIAPSVYIDGAAEQRGHDRG